MVALNPVIYNQTETNTPQSFLLRLFRAFVSMGSTWLVMIAGFSLPFDSRQRESLSVDKSFQM